MTEKETRKDPLRRPDETSSGNKVLVLHNDDVHSFDYVIAALVEVCDHDFHQALQCTTITHYKGRCDIKRGKLAGLKQMKEALAERELTVTID